jgi:hypothetical protein
MSVCHITVEDKRNGKIQGFWKPLISKEKIETPPTKFRKVSKLPSGVDSNCLNTTVHENRKFSSLARLHRVSDAPLDDERRVICCLNGENDVFSHESRTKFPSDPTTIEQPNSEVKDLRSTGKIYRILVYPWFHMELDRGIESADDIEAKAARNTDFLIHACPDPSFAMGPYTKEKGTSLLRINSSRDVYIELIVWKSEPGGAILCTWIPRLRRSYGIYRVDSQDGATLGFYYENKGSRSKTRGTAFGNCTTTFIVHGLDVDAKYQYIELGRRFSERENLGKLREKMDISGVVHLPLRKTLIGLQTGRVNVELEEEVTNGKIRIDVRERLRLMSLHSTILTTSGQTPKDALIAIYDLLECK